MLRKGVEKRRKSFERRMKKGNMSYDSVGKWEKYISKTNRPYHKFENQLITKHLKQKNTKNTKNKRSNSEQPFKL